MIICKKFKRDENGKTEFTDGPWHNKGKRVFWKKPDRKLPKDNLFNGLVCICATTEDNPPEVIEEANANANLIAQAPAMYEILEKILENHCRRCRNDADNPMDGGRVACGNGKRECPFHMDDVKDVLAKARGEK